MSNNKSYEAKQQIAEAFHTMSKKKSINSITVTDIMRSCGKTRQMFYHYFQDLDDLILWIHTDITEQFAIDYFNGTTSEESSAKYLESMVKYKAFYKYILNKNGHHSFYKWYSRLIENYVLTYIKKYKRHTPTEDEVFAIKLFWRGLTSMIVEWIENDMKEEPQVISSRFHKCMPPILMQYML